MNALIRITSIILLFILSLLVFALKPIEREGQTKQDFYRNTQTLYTDYKPEKQLSQDKVLSGYSKTSILPGSSLPMAGYGKRKGAHYEGVIDSIWCRTIVLDNEIDRLALISLDLLIVPPLVSEILKQRVSEIGWKYDQLHLSATHSHHSIGGWQPGLVGSLFAGEFESEVNEMIAEQIINSILKATKDMSATSIGFSSIAAPQFVFNRLVREKGRVDSNLRMLRFSREDSTNLAYLTYSAHATCLQSSFLQISRDYPGILVDQLERDPQIDFAVFAAGAVGSHGPAGDDSENYGMVMATKIGMGLAEAALEHFGAIKTIDSVVIGSCELPLEMGEPQFKVTKDWAGSNWLFSWAFGDFPYMLKFAKIGDVELVGVPGDFTGEAYERFLGSDSLMITSFNGSYAGYFIEKQWYDLEKYESRTMSWYGPYQTDFVVSLSNNILEDW